MRTKIALLAAFVLLLSLAACQPQTETVEVTRVVTETQVQEVEVEVTRVVTEVQTETVVEEVLVEAAPLGSAERPIKVLFVPSVDVDVLISGGEVLADALEEATGMSFEVSVPTSYAAAIEEMCASPDDTVGFIPAQGYVLANDRCGVTVGAAAVRFGLEWYAAEFVVLVDSTAQTLADLDGKSWCIPDYASTSGYLYPSATFLDMGIVPSQIIEAGGHNNSLLGVVRGDCDFATAFFSPPQLPGRSWVFGVDSPEIWRDAGEPAIRNEAGRTFVAGGPDEGGYRILDARTLIIETVPDVFEQTRILALTDQIPNDTVSFGPEFPLAMANKIVNALVEFTSTDACLESICGEASYSWTGVKPVSDSFYDPVRRTMSALGISEEDILGG